jgi:hypothetical protein
LDKGESGEVSVSGTAFDAQDTLSLIEIKVDDGEWFAVGASSQWSYDLDITDIENGEHTLYARSYDGTAYSAEDSVEFEVTGKAPVEEEGISSTIIMGAVGLAVIAALAGFFVFRKMRSGSTS